jgi:microtubule-associated protein, RP/EB family
LNDLLHLNLAKVEECASGAVICQVFDVLLPGKVPMRKVKFDVKMEYEFEHNWRLLSSVFVNCGINRNIPIDRLIKARQQDNLEFLQWVYEFFLRTYDGHAYDPEKRRAVARGGANYVKSRSGAVKSSAATAFLMKNTESSRVQQEIAKKSSVTPAVEKPSERSSGGSSNSQEVDSASVERQVAIKTRELLLKITQLQSLATELEKERDQYFEKIAQIDEVCKTAISECEHMLEEQDDELAREACSWKAEVCLKIHQIIYAEDQEIPADTSNMKIDLPSGEQSLDNQGERLQSLRALHDHLA